MLVVLDVEAPRTPSLVVLETSSPFAARAGARHRSLARGLASVSLAPHADDRVAKISQLGILSTRAPRDDGKALLYRGLFECALAVVEMLKVDVFKLPHRPDRCRGQF